MANSTAKSSQSPFDYNHPRYRDARIVAIKRSEGWCQFCGLRRASEAHHWRGYLAGEYKSAEETTADELMALCSSCHDIATAIRKGYHKGYHKGYEDSKKSGYKEGYSAGHEEGSEEGYSAGHEEGSEEGYLEWQRFFDNADDFEEFLEWKRDFG